METPNTRKYILIPEYKPLFAMRKCFGPPHGPLLQPCPTSLDIIGELLGQSGNDSLTIMEVVPTANGYSDPVRLTPENYKLPYAEIVAAMKGEREPSRTVAPPAKMFKPEMIPDDPIPLPDSETNTEPEAAPVVTPTDPVDTPVVAGNDPNKATEDDLPGYTMGPTSRPPEIPVVVAVGTITDDSYPGYAACGMSKKEWKAAKALAQKEAAENTATGN